MSGTVTVPFFLNQQGCTHQCSYCAQETINGHDGKLPDAGEIRRKVAAYGASANGRQLHLAYYGGSFTSLPPINQEELLSTAAQLRREGVLTGIRISTRPDGVTPESVSRLVRHGVETVELGVQSLDDGVLRAAGRGHDAEVVAPAVRALQAAGCEVGIQLMTGLPGDTPDHAVASMRKALAMAPAFLRIYPTLVLAGSALARAFIAGDHQPWSLELTVATVKRMLLLAMQSGVPVVRIGLQESPSLRRPGAILGGPYHPALGELVQTVLWQDLLQLLLGDCSCGPLEIRCAPTRLSSLVGQKRCNIDWLVEKTGINKIRVAGDSQLTPTQLTVTAPGIFRMGDLLKDLDYDHTNC